MTVTNDDLIEAPTIPTPLGPGDDDPRSTVAPAPDDTSLGPLGPGDDDPRSPAQDTAAAAIAPLGPGDASGENPDDAFTYLAPSPARPGDLATGPRHLVRIPKPPTVIAPLDTAVQTERQE